MTPEPEPITKKDVQELKERILNQPLVQKVFILESERAEMTPEQKAANFSKSIKCIDWLNGDPVANFWLEGYLAKAEFYTLEATIRGMEKRIAELEKSLEIERGKKNE